MSTCYDCGQNECRCPASWVTMETLKESGPRWMGWIHLAGLILCWLAASAALVIAFILR